jgi:hypothetical protein
LLPVGLIPSDLAQSLTESILSQPPPLQLQSADHEVESQLVRSRKENSRQAQRVDARPLAISSATGGLVEPQPIRKVSQTLSHVSVGSTVSASTGGVSLEDDLILSRTNSPLRSVSQHCLQLRSSLELEPPADFPGDSVSNNTLAVSSGNTMNKGTKRTRNFTPGSAKAVDEENEPRRVSPRLNTSSFRECEDRGKGQTKAPARPV